MSNLIGTTANGTGSLGNIENGVFILGGASNNLVGGTLPETANTIAFNGGAVVVLRDDSTGNSILRNSMFSNDHSGIDLGDTGATPNDPGDGDAGPNNLQNKPVLEGAERIDDATTLVPGNLSSTPNRTFVLRFFSNPPGGDEGKVFRGRLSVDTDDAGDAVFVFQSPTAIPVGQTVTATATNTATGDTSEFSAAVPVA